MLFIYFLFQLLLRPRHLPRRVQRSLALHLRIHLLHAGLPGSGEEPLQQPWVLHHLTKTLKWQDLPPRMEKAPLCRQDLPLRMVEHLQPCLSCKISFPQPLPVCHLCQCLCWGMMNLSLLPPAHHLRLHPGNYSLHLCHWFFVCYKISFTFTFLNFFHVCLFMLIDYLPLTNFFASSASSSRRKGTPPKCRTQLDSGKFVFALFEDWTGSGAGDDGGQQGGSAKD